MGDASGILSFFAGMNQRDGLRDLADGLASGAIPQDQAFAKIAHITGNEDDVKAQLLQQTINQGQGLNPNGTVIGPYAQGDPLNSFTPTPGTGSPMSLPDFNILRGQNTGDVGAYEQGRLGKYTQSALASLPAGASPLDQAQAAATAQATQTGDFKPIRDLNDWLLSKQKTQSEIGKNTAETSAARASAAKVSYEMGGPGAGGGGIIAEPLTPLPAPGAGGPAITSQTQPTADQAAQGAALAGLTGGAGATLANAVSPAGSSGFTDPSAGRAANVPAPLATQGTVTVTGGLSPKAAQEAALHGVEQQQDVQAKGQAASAEDAAKNSEAAHKTAALMLQNLPLMSQQFDKMRAANQSASFGPLNDEEGKGVVTALHDMGGAGGILSGPEGDATSQSNAQLKTLAAQNVIREIGPQLAQGGLKGNKFLEGLVNSAAGIDLTASRSARSTQIDALQNNYNQALKSTIGQLKQYGVDPTSMIHQALPTPEAVADAVHRGALDRADAAHVLATYHGFQRKAAQ